MAAFKASARSLDQGVGAVLDALDAHGLADDTLVICTTDHGIAFPGAKAPLRPRPRRHADRARPGRLQGRPGRSTRWSPTSTSTRRCATSPGIERPPGCRAARCCRSSRREVDEVHDAIFAEATYHAAYEPQRACARSARSTSAATATARRRCWPTPTTARARTCCSSMAGASAPIPPSSSTTSSSTPTRRPTWSATRAYAGRAAGPRRAPRPLDARHRRPAPRRPGRPAARRADQPPRPALAGRTNGHRRVTSSSPAPVASSALTARGSASTVSRNGAISASCEIALSAAISPPGRSVRTRSGQ